MATHGERHVVGYKPADTNQGWGAALFICALTTALAISAFVIHKQTYKDPTDPRTPNVHQMADYEGAQHSPAAAEH